MKKFYFKSSVLQLVKTVAVILLLNGCIENQASSLTSTNVQAGTAVILAIDETQSFINYAKLDTNFVSSVCHSVPSTGGLVAITSIGESSDQSFLRCYLKALPVINENLILSKQAELKVEITTIMAENQRQIHQFLKKVHEKIFVPMNDPKRKVVITDINGVLRKAVVLLGESSNLNMRKLMFIYSDGIQSKNGKDTPACFEIKPHSNFTLCLCGWKTGPPCDLEIMQFEAPEGFLKFLDSDVLSTIKN